MWLVIFACILEMINGGTHLEESILNPPPHTQMEVLVYKLQLGGLMLNSLALENRLTCDIQPVWFGCTDLKMAYHCGDPPQPPADALSRKGAAIP